VSDSQFTIRPARPNDATRLQAIELVADKQFAAIGYATLPPESVETLNAYANAGRSWVVVANGEVVGYILVGVVDGAAHIFQVTVHPDFQGQGFGKALVEQAKTWARSTGRQALTLATYQEVPWNRPLYEHLGFRIFDDSEFGPEMRAGQEHDAAKGLGPGGRVAMRLDID